MKSTVAESTADKIFLVYINSLPVLVFPNCKINLGLHVVRKRSDGFHDLETVFYPLPFYDALELITAPPKNPEHFTQVPHNNTVIYFAASGLEIPGNPQDNILIRACRLLLPPDAPSFQIHLHKQVPMGAGLGGGSANGAFMLQLLQEVFHLNLPQNKLMPFAKQLGSDCPFFLENKPVFATGRGDITENIPVDLSGFSLMLIYPGIHIPTARSYAVISPAPRATSLKAVIRRPVTDWKEHLVNDFEKNAFVDHPELAGLKTMLYEKGAVYASMTGSGSCIYGLFPSAIAPSIELPATARSWFFPSI
jgi:4-diphosphocytidyl-2-C-methyl-D-erythritol kinase